MIRMINPKMLLLNVMPKKVVGLTLISTSLEVARINGTVLACPSAGQSRHAEAG